MDGSPDLDIARAQAEVIRAIVEGREPRAVLGVLVERLRHLLGASRCFVILVDRQQRGQRGGADLLVGVQVLLLRAKLRGVVAADRLLGVLLRESRW